MIGNHYLANFMKGSLYLANCTIGNCYVANCAIANCCIASFTIGSCYCTISTIAYCFLANCTTWNFCIGVVDDTFMINVGKSFFSFLIFQKVKLLKRKCSLNRSKCSKKSWQIGATIKNFYWQSWEEWQLDNSKCFFARFYFHCVS